MNTAVHDARPAIASAHSKPRARPGFHARSGKRDSNPRPSAWEADALPTELLPQTIELTVRPSQCQYDSLLYGVVFVSLQAMVYYAVIATAAPKTAPITSPESDETHLSPEPTQTREQARVSLTHGDQERPQDPRTAPRERPKEPIGQCHPLRQVTPPQGHPPPASPARSVSRAARSSARCSRAAIRRSDQSPQEPFAPSFASSRSPPRAPHRSRWASSWDDALARPSPETVSADA